MTFLLLSIQHDIFVRLLRSLILYITTTSCKVWGGSNTLIKICMCYLLMYAVVSLDFKEKKNWNLAHVHDYATSITLGKVVRCTEQLFRHGWVFCLNLSFFNFIFRSQKNTGANLIPGPWWWSFVHTITFPKVCHVTRNGCKCRVFFFSFFTKFYQENLHINPKCDAKLTISSEETGRCATNNNTRAKSKNA